MAAPLLKIGKVSEVENSMTKDGTGAMRIRVRFPHDNEPGNDKNLPWVWPLLPKAFQTAPKIGEAVLVMNTDPSFPNSQRYYIGPIISQPQYQYKNSYDDATTMLKGEMHEPIASIDTNPDAKGSFPKQTDVAVVGRKSEDIILRDSEINIRAGIRQKPAETNGMRDQGYIIFNNINPAYIQLKFNDNGSFTGDANGVYHSSVNIVADKINLISNNDKSSKVTDNIHDPDELITNDKLPSIMNELHQVPLGDKLVYLLKIMRGAIMNHVHPWAGMQQCGDWAGYVPLLEKYDIDSILSDDVRIS